MSASARAQRRDLAASQPTAEQLAAGLAALAAAYGSGKPATRSPYGINGRGTGRPVNSSGSLAVTAGKRHIPPRTSGEVFDCYVTLPITAEDGTTVVIGKVIPAESQTRQKSTRTSRARAASQPDAPVFGREAARYTADASGVIITGTLEN